ncbi:hypothetical protein LCGC14_2911270 [marine sediment metagenome]|uniref:BppU N-terminal domain-containing protein n=1 Tax=marine sediment metagenome TaxID=412755 RepID=A0A0F9AHP1_9ZZZZ
MGTPQIKTVYESAARVATPTAVELDMSTVRGLILVVDCTADPVLASVVFNVDGVDPTSGTAWTILDSTAVDGVGTTILRIGPEMTASAGATARDVVPPVVRVTSVHADADSITYSVAAHAAT